MLHLLFRNLAHLGAKNRHPLLRVTQSTDVWQSSMNIHTSPTIYTSVANFVPPINSTRYNLTNDFVSPSLKKDYSFYLYIEFCPTEALTKDTLENFPATNCKNKKTHYILSSSSHFYVDHILKL